MTGRKFVEPKMPRAVLHLWNHYTVLHRGRGNNGFGVSPLTWAEIGAYCALFRVQFEPWEVELILLIDDEFIDSLADDKVEPAEQ